MLKVINLTKVKQVRRMKKKSWRLSLHCIHTVSWKHFPFFLFRLLRLFIIIYYILSFSPQIFKMKNIEKYKHVLRLFTGGKRISPGLLWLGLLLLIGTIRVVVVLASEGLTNRGIEHSPINQVELWFVIFQFVKCLLCHRWKTDMTQEEHWKWNLDVKMLKCQLCNHLLKKR